jgi:pSer/pThr/pTyr-binding forkhead associated (FHA) protein
MPYLSDLATELRTQGRARFLETYPGSSVLVGVGVLGVLVESERTPEGTLRINVGNSSEYLRTASLVERVWFLVKKPGKRDVPRIVLGRTSEADVSVPELSISVEHCAFEAGPFGLRLVDIESTNGTLLNGSPVEPHRSVPLRSHDRLVIGRFEFEYLRHKELMDRLAKYVPAADD